MSGCYGIGAVEAALALTPEIGRMPKVKLPTDPVYERFDLALFERAGKGPTDFSTPLAGATQAFNAVVHTFLRIGAALRAALVSRSTTPAPKL